eukprot:14659416-Alexandrium_andersonii.AAC.1
MLGPRQLPKLPTGTLRHAGNNHLFTAQLSPDHGASIKPGKLLEDAQEGPLNLGGEPDKLRSPLRNRGPELIPLPTGHPPTIGQDISHLVASPVPSRDDPSANITLSGAPGDP